MLLPADDRASEQPGEIVALADRLLQGSQIGASLLEATALQREIEQGAGVTAGHPGCRGAGRHSMLPRLAARAGYFLVRGRDVAVLHPRGEWQITQRPHTRQAEPPGRSLRRFAAARQGFSALTSRGGFPAGGCKTRVALVQIRRIRKHEAGATSTCRCRLARVWGARPSADVALRAYCRATTRGP